MEQLSEKQILELELKANEVRQLIITTLLEAKSGHTGGPLGMADIFTALYFHIAKYDPQNPDMPDRDRIILSNGHIVPVRYVTMALAGFFPVEELKTLRKLNSRLQGHPHRTALPGTETTSGPLGEGLSQAVGMALVGKMDHKDYYIYALTSDGEHQEGSTWEAAMSAGKWKLDNLIQIIDFNDIQIDGPVSKVMPLEPFKAKYEAFNWHVKEVDGNDMAAVIRTIEMAKSLKEKPTLILAHTNPGKGVSFMEHQFTWHGKPPNAEEAEKALEELKKTEENIRQRLELV